MVTIKEGGFYRRRDGLKVGPLRESKGREFPFIDYATVESYRADGTWSAEMGEEDEKDLVAEWADAPAAPRAECCHKTVLARCADRPYTADDSGQAQREPLDLQPGPVVALPDPDKPTLWDRYAMAALAGSAQNVPHEPGPDGKARRAASIADAMMAERAKRFTAGPL